jgi:serine/threonine-protein kinase
MMGPAQPDRRGLLEWLRPPAMTPEERRLYTLTQEGVIVDRFGRAAPFGATATLAVGFVGSIHFEPEWRRMLWISGALAAAGLLVVHGVLRPKSRPLRMATTAAAGLSVAAVIDLMAIPTGGVGSPAFPAITLIWLYGSVVAPLNMREILMNVALELCLAVAMFTPTWPVGGRPGEPAMTLLFVLVGFMLLVLGTALRERGTIQAFLTQRRLDDANHQLSEQRAALEQLNGELEHHVDAQVAEIRSRAHDVEVLNRQLQERVVERSRELAAALARVAEGGGNPSIVAGAVLNGRFEIVRAIGSGGMGEVFEGIDRVTGTRVAVKAIHGKHRHDVLDLQRFLVEARAAAAVSHEGIVRTFDVDVTPEGTVFHVMELLEGTTMADWIGAPGRRPIGAVAAVGRVLADALAAAHRAGVVHRDVKPGNVMLAQRGRSIKVLDFGLSKIVEAGASPISVTHSQMVMGTPAYMAPEQFLHSKSAGPEADVYSLGVVLYEAFAGVLPFDGETNVAFFVAHTEHDPVHLRAKRSEVPADVSSMIMRCLEKDLRERPSAEDVARVLEPHARADELRVDDEPASEPRFDPDATTIQEPQS